MALIGMRDVCWGFGGAPLLENINLQIEKGQRIGLLGRNGVGKSSLLKLLSKDMRPDSGEVWRSQGVTVAELRQDVPGDFGGTVFDVVALGFGAKGKTLAKYRQVCARLALPANKESENLNKKHDALQHELVADGGWDLMPAIENVLSRNRLEAEAGFAQLSAGMKRRVLFAKALVSKPDLLLLDEPTNHLDIDAIIWMEDFIRQQVTTLVFVTHDRLFLKKVANRIVEIDRGRLTVYDCNYDTYLKRRDDALNTETRQNGLFDKKLAKEEGWIRQGIKARRTRNEGRVRALVRLREAYRARRKKLGSVRLQVQEAEKSGRLVIEAQGVCQSYNGAMLIKDFSGLIMRGDKVGIIGPNGVGKTTLLKLLLKQQAPDSGHVRHGTHFEMVYFDQLRAQLDEQKTVSENIAEGNDYIIFNGQKRHVISYLKDFLFSAERCRTPLQVLSGGEKNRLLLAKLFTRPANVMVLDEPTNDLDVETLALLEEMLFDYQGTLLLVSHDRSFLNNVVTSTIVFEGYGQVVAYAGGYDDWVAQRPVETKVAAGVKKSGAQKTPKPKKKVPRKLGFNEKNELIDLPKTIETLEAEQGELYAAMSEPLFYQKKKETISATKARLDEVTKTIEIAYARWETLEKIANN
jgi:ABC transport system ATP-binding/permease protein